MKKIALILSFAALSMMTFVSCDDDDTVSPLDSAQFKNFNDAMRELWSDHVVYTRNVITNIIDGLPGTDEAVDRLLQNQVDIGNAIKPYYGDAAGESLTDLLTTHINQAASILTAARNGDTETFNTTSTAWYANGDDIAEFLNAANPQHWELAEMKAMMKEHLDLTLQEATARLNGDYAADIASFDQVYNQIMEMADMLAEGIANQFPDKF